MEKPKKSVRRKSRGVTIDEVAALAGVSPMTVSRVMNGQGKVRDATRERVTQAVRELDYTPNLAASSLAAAQHTRIALIYTNPSGAYLRELLVGLLRVASRTAIQLVIDYWDDLDAESERKAARALTKKVDGVILPVVGEFSVRSFFGWIGDGFMNPLGYIPGAPFFTPTVAAYIVRNVNLLAQGMPSPGAPEGDWVAYEQARFEFQPYEVGRDLF